MNGHAAHAQLDLKRLTLVPTNFLNDCSLEALLSVQTRFDTKVNFTEKAQLEASLCSSVWDTKRNPSENLNPRHSKDPAPSPGRVADLLLLEPVLARRQGLRQILCHQLHHHLANGVLATLGSKKTNQQNLRSNYVSRKGVRLGCNVRKKIPKPPVARIGLGGK